MNRFYHILRFSALLVFSIACMDAFAQKQGKKTDTFKVYGNCEMCQETIETALKKSDGIFKRSWSPETKMLEVTYDPAKITLAQIKQKVAEVGYDSDDVRASETIYKGLHKCCQYERPKDK